VDCLKENQQEELNENNIKKMETVKVYSPVNDENIQKNLNGSPIWKGLRYTEDEIVEAQKKHKELYEYSIKFDGLKPIMLNKMSKLPI
jgi:hypothetical protein